MPQHANITLSLQSQYDAASVREHNTLRREYDTAAATTCAVVDVDINALPASQFWISYICNPHPINHSHPPGNPSVEPAASADQGDQVEEVRFFYFKLLIEGSCVLSWGVGAEETWRGKTVVGFFDGGTDFEGRRVVEKRGLFFGSGNALRTSLDSETMEMSSTSFEVQVFRAKARRRSEVQYGRMRDGDQGIV
jgi:hypothetical protein